MTRAVKPCGTEAAWQRHRYAGEQPCQPCIDAHRADRAAKARAAYARTGPRGRVAVPAVRPPTDPTEVFWRPPAPTPKSPPPPPAVHPVETRPCDRYGIPQSDRAVAYVPLDHAARGSASDLVRVAFPEWAPLTPCRT